jgi:hypothetical protein
MAYASAYRLAVLITSLAVLLAVPVAGAACKSGQAHCTKCKSEKVCKTCAAGYELAPDGSCIYKCALPSTRTQRA